MSELLNQYIKDCLRTEPKLEPLKINVELVARLFHMYHDLSEILDAVKKSTFYNKDEKLTTIFHNKLNNLIMTAKTLEDYTESNLTSKEETDFNFRIFHGILGIMTEAGELSEIWDKYMIEGNPIDPIHLGEELGDQNWYQSILNDELKLDPEETLHKNIRKLRIRFPEKFTDHHAANRDLEAERKELES